MTPACGGDGIIPAEDNHDQQRQHAQQPSGLTLPYRRPNPYLPSKSYNQRMGLKSQQAVSAIKASKKKGSSWFKNSKSPPKKKNQGKEQCRVCRAKALKIKVPKRAHHPNCELNRDFKKKRRQQQQDQNEGVPTTPPPANAASVPLQLTETDTGEENSQMNPLVIHPSMIHQSTNSWEVTIAAKTQNPVSTPGSPAGRSQEVGRGPTVPNRHTEDKHVNNLHCLVSPPLGQLLRNELERRLGVLKSTAAGEEKKSLERLLHARTKGVPVGVQLLFDYIDSEVAMKRRSKTQEQQGDAGGGSSSLSSVLTYDQHEAMMKRRTYFHDQQCFFTFPPDPSPHPLAEYHFIEGMSIFMLDLEVLLLQTAGGGCSPTMSTPRAILRCVSCQGGLDRLRTNWSKRKTLFPVLEQNGLFSFGSVMMYQCESCKANYPANHGSILLQIPPHLRRAYPVEPRFALSGFNFHLSKDVTCNLRGAMLTQGSGENESKLLYRKSREKYMEAVETFLSKLPDAINLGQPFPITFKEWCRFPPSGDQLRNYYRQGEQSSDTVYGYSNKDRYAREIQSVGAHLNEGVKAVVIDWTFQALKTYKGLGPQGGKCMFTMKVVGDRGKLTAGAVIVPNTSAAAISHFMINMITKRDGLKQASLIFTDEWPSASTFWADIFGHHIVGRLGLFHAMKRITDSIERGEDWEFFNGMLYDLRLCFYGYHNDDMGSVVASLKAGTMTRDKHKYTAKEIEVFQKTPEWNRRFSSYIRKTIYNGHLIAQKLEEFRSKYENICDTSGKKRFTTATSKAIDDLLGKVDHIGDLPEQFAPYRFIPAGPNSTHGLPTYESLRPESALEKFHHLLAHFGNIGMSKDLADTILLRGIAEDNVRIQHQQHPKNPDVPSRFEDEPEYFDHSQLYWINSVGKQKGYVDNIFKAAHAGGELQPDNGEVFLSEYLEQEMGRRKKGLVDMQKNKCNCPHCVTFAFPLIRSAAVPVRTVAPQPITTTNNERQEALRRSSREGNSTDNTPAPVQEAAARLLPNQLVRIASTQPSTTTVITAPFVLFGPPPHPMDCCFMYQPFFCQERWAWQAMKDSSGSQRLGAPKHSPLCPRRCARASIYSPFA